MLACALPAILDLGGCGRVEFSPLADAGLDAQGPPPSLVFGDPVAIAELNSPQAELHPTLRGDQLEIFFASGRGGAGNDIYTATRATIDDVWSAPVLVPELSSTFNDHAVVLAPDGLSAYVTRLAAPAVAYLATRASLTSAWTTPVPAPGLAAYGLGGFTADALSIYVDAMTIELAQRATVDAEWDAPVPLGTGSELAGNDPWPDGSGRVVVFTDTRATGAGGVDLWAATRASIADPFASVTLVSVSSAGADATPWLSPDGATLVFARNGDLVIAHAL